MDPYVLRLVSRGKTPATGRLEHLPKLWLRAPVRIELACAGPEDTQASLDDVGTYSLAIHSLDADRNPVDSPLLWYQSVSPAGNTGATKGPHAVFEISTGAVANITEAGDYWIAVHAHTSGERLLRAAGYLTFVDDGYPNTPPTPTPPGTVYLTQAAGDARYVRDPGTVTDNAIVRWNGTSGNLVQNSGVTVSDTGDIDIPGSVSIGSGAGVLGIRVDNLTADRTHQAADEDGTLALTDNINGSPDRIEIYVKCAEVGGVTTGQAVYISGASGGNKLITKALASGESTSSKTIGLVMQNLAHNGFGYVVTEGRIEVSLAAGTAAEGDPVWLSPTTAGGLVYGLANKPSAPNHMVFLGYITRINGGTIAQIYVKVQNGFELEELHNVAISSPATSHTIFWNGSRWANRAIGTGDFTGTATTGYVLTVVGGVPTWAAAAGGSGSTNLAFTQNETSITITSDTGTDATLPLADASFAGLMGPDQVTKLAGIAEGATANVGTVTGLAAGTSGAGVTVAIAGTSAVPTVAVSLGANSVGSSQLADASVTLAKMANVATGTVFYRKSAGSGPPETQTLNTLKVDLGLATRALNLQNIFSMGSDEVLTGVDATADKLVWWDNTANQMDYLTVGSGLSIDNATKTISSTGGSGGTPGGDTGELQYNNAGAFASVTNSSVSGSTITLGNAEALGTGVTPYLTLLNTTASTAVLNQNSPAITWLGTGWASTPAESRVTEWRSYNLNSGGAADPTSQLVFQGRVSGGAWQAILRLQVGANGNYISGSGVSAEFGTTVIAACNVLSVAQLNSSVTGLRLRSDYNVSWSSSTAVPGSPDLYIRRRAANNLQLGVSDTTGSSLSAQTISINSSQTADYSLASISFTLDSSRGCGSGVGGEIIARTAPASAGGSSAQNQLVETLRIRPGQGIAVANSGLISATSRDSLSRTTVLHAVSVGSDASVPLSESWGVKWTTGTYYATGVRVYNRQGSYVSLPHTSGATTEPGVGPNWTSVWTLVTRPGMSIPTGTVGQALILITGTSTAGDVARYMRQVSYKNVGGLTSMVGTEITVGTDITATTSISVTVSDGTDSLEVNCTGVSGQTWRWQAVIFAQELAIGS